MLKENKYRFKKLYLNTPRISDARPIGRALDCNPGIAGSILGRAKITP